MKKLLGVVAVVLLMSVGCSENEEVTPAAVNTEYIEDGGELGDGPSQIEDGGELGGGPMDI